MHRRPSTTAAAALHQLEMHWCCTTIMTWHWIIFHCATTWVGPLRELESRWSAFPSISQMILKLLKMSEKEDRGKEEMTTMLWYGVIWWKAWWRLCQRWTGQYPVHMAINVVPLFSGCFWSKPAFVPSYIAVLERAAHQQCRKGIYLTSS